MKHFDSKTDEAVGIEGEKRSNRVDVHGRDQPSIMYFRTAHAVLGDLLMVRLGSAQKDIRVDKNAHLAT